MVGTRIIFLGINPLARWHKENTVETVFVACLSSVRHCVRGLAQFLPRILITNLRRQVAGSPH